MDRLLPAPCRVTVGNRWGSLVTSVCFTGIHVPRALDGPAESHEIATNLLFLAGVAVGVRLLIARVDPWSGQSLLTVGILHSSFNATETVLDPDYFWVRIVITIAAGIGVVALGRQAHPWPEPTPIESSSGSDWTDASKTA